MTENIIDLQLLINEIRARLPDPVRDDIHTIQLHAEYVFIGGDPAEVIVQIDGNKITVSEYSVRWEGPYTPTVHPKKLAALNWKRLPANISISLLHSLINTTVQLRRAKYRTCEKCGETNPPEWMHGDNICQSCAEQYLGVVH